MLIPLGLPFAKEDAQIQNLSQKWKSFKVKTYVAAGQSGNGIPEGVKLWPQELYKHPNLILVGSQYKKPDGALETPRNQLYAKEIEQYFELDHSQAYAGSSVAVTLCFVTHINQKRKPVKTH